MTAAVYASAVRGFVTGELDWETDDIRMLLVRDRYEPNQSGDRYRSSLGLAEAVPSGNYPSEGLRVEARDVQPSGTMGTRLVGAVKALQGFSGEFRYGVIYQHLGDNVRDTEPLVAVTDFGVQVLSNADVSVTFDPHGICVFEPEPIDG